MNITKNDDQSGRMMDEGKLFQNNKGKTLSKVTVDFFYANKDSFLLNFFKIFSSFFFDYWDL